MYAIVETGGKQYRVKPGDTIAVERIAGEPGEVLDLGRVLLVAGNGDAAARIGSPGVEGAVVRAEVVEHARGEKIIVFRYKSKVRYRRKTGHRQALTRLRITDIVLNGKSTAPVTEARETAGAADATRPVETAPAAEAAEMAVPVPTEARPGPSTESAPAADAARPADSTRAAPAGDEVPSAEVVEVTPADAATEAEMPVSAGEAGPPSDEEAPEHTEA